MKDRVLFAYAIREMCPGEFSENNDTCAACPYKGHNKCYSSMMYATQGMLQEFITQYKGETERDSKRDLYGIITELAHRLGVPSHLSGFSYIRRAISITIENPGAAEAITKILYPQIAREFHTTPSRVERAIRHAVETAWTRGDQEFQDKVFGWTVAGYKGKPTNSEFIATLADYICLTYDVSDTSK